VYTGAKSGTLTIRIYNDRDQQTPPEAVSLVVNACAAHDWGQLLMFEGKSRSLFTSFTTGAGLPGLRPRGKKRHFSAIGQDL